ncbi:hypothetical protein LG634_20850 [Streptomyces bambusae]|uniref:hypothetical protein n=1 Tax=Streptomyces bambusae TaxID=1550616 RepID=UPI001CFE3FA3|nr:hypothetical protein [Streptomyces bambusae]MCB5167279.1 hypothetical protein [Streptomyces bambusae]
MVTHHSSATPWPRGFRVCSVYLGREISDLDVDVSQVDEEHVAGPSDEPTTFQYALGTNALANPTRAFLYFACLSRRLPSSTGEPVVLLTEVRNTAFPTADPKTVREAHLVLAHAAAVAVAAELGCARGAGLPKKPVLRMVSGPVPKGGDGR